MIRCRLRRPVLLGLLVVPICFVVSGLIALDLPEPAPVERTSSVPANLASPRATIATFLEATQPGRQDRAKATACLDLSQLGYPHNAEAAWLVAHRLKYILDRIALLELSEFSNESIEPSYRRELHRSDKDLYFPLVFQRQDNGTYLIAHETLIQIEPTYRKVFDWGVADERIHSQTNLGETIEGMIPVELRSGGFLLKYWQWAGLMLLIFIGLILDRVTTFVLRSVVRRAIEHSGMELDQKYASTAERPLGLVAMALLFLFGIQLLNLPAQVLSFLNIAGTFFATLAVVWSIYRAVDLLCAYLAKLASKTRSKMDDLLVPLVRKTLKIFVTLFGALFVLGNLGLDITSFFLSLSIGGLAFALAAKDTLSNLFGSVTVLIDQPFQIGDWVVIGNVEGTVEEVGLRSTRIRTFYNSLVTIPNGNLISANIDNYGARFKRRIKCYISITYDTPPEKIEAFCEGIRALNLKHPYTTKDFYHVYFNQFSASSLDILLYLFLKTPDWATELRERERLFLDIVRLARRLGISFAFPTQTLHIESAALPERKTKEAMEIDFVKDLEAARRLGQKEAEALAARHYTSAGEIPPPVRFDYDPNRPADRGGA